MPDRPTILRIALEAQLDWRTVRRVFESGSVDVLHSDHAKTRLRAALKKLKVALP